MVDDTHRLANLSLGKPAEAGQFILERRARLIRRHAPDLGGVLLDYGCGNGAQTIAFVADFARVVGVDVEAGHVQEFADAVARLGLDDRVTPRYYDGRRLPLGDGEIDAVISFEVLEHVADEQESLAEIRRVLRPGGWLALTVPNRWWLFETHGANLPLLPWNRVPFFSWLPKTLHDRWARARIYRRREIRKLVNDCGFSIRHAAYVTAPLDVLRWRQLRDGLRGTLFASDTTQVPFMATAVLVVAIRE